MNTCTACNHSFELNLVSIVGRISAGSPNIHVNCPACGSTVGVHAGPLTPNFELLSELSGAVGAIEIGNIKATPEVLDHTRVALDFMAHNLTEPLDLQFSRNIAARIDRIEQKQKAA